MPSSGGPGPRLRLPRAGRGPGRRERARGRRAGASRVSVVEPARVRSVRVLWRGCHGEPRSVVPALHTRVSELGTVALGSADAVDSDVSVRRALPAQCQVADRASPHPRAHSSGQGLLQLCPDGECVLSCRSPRDNASPRAPAGRDWLPVPTGTPGEPVTERPPHPRCHPTRAEADSLGGQAPGRVVLSGAQSCGVPDLGPSSPEQGVAWPPGFRKCL